jgi:hypothetical protein
MSDQPVTFLIGDVVLHIENEGKCTVAMVTGFCPGDAFVRVRGDDGIARIWKKVNVWNDSDYVRRQVGVRWSP